MKVRTHYNYDFESTNYEPGGGELISIPDQSLSVKQILEKFRRGNFDPSELERQVYYDNDEDISVFLDEIDDISDLAQLVSKAQDRISLLRNQVNESSEEVSDVVSD